MLRKHVTICTSGRFHVADLARELLTLGHEVEFHSIVPYWRLGPFGIPRAQATCHLPSVIGLALSLRLLNLPTAVQYNLDHRQQLILDREYARMSLRGEIFIGMSGLCVESLRAAKNRGMKVLLERGSQHILEQKAILDAIMPGQASLVPDWVIDRELQGYETADVIVVPSRHAEESFLRQGIPAARIFRNPYGVATDLFKPHDGISPQYDVIMVGSWCRRKGCDQLATVVLEDLDLSLLHVGPVGDLPLPRHAKFRHIGPVAQAKLPNYYAMAKVFAMPSREDGFGLVFSQALACGLPIIGTAMTGLSDIAEMAAFDHKMISLIHGTEKEELSTAIKNALKHVDDQSEYKILLNQQVRDALTWKSYGDRYSAFLQD